MQKKRRNGRAPTKTPVEDEQHRPKGPELRQRKTRNTTSTALGLRAQPRPPGTEFIDAETARQKSPPKRVSAHRDQNPGNEWPEIPAETRYSASCRKRAVCGDWMVVCAVRYEPVSIGNFTGNRE